MSEELKDLTPQEQEMLKYLEELQANNPAEYDLLVQEMQERKGGAGTAGGGGAGGKSAQQQQGEQVTPKPGFVAKTRSATRQGAKVFINVCSSEHVDPPAPVNDVENSDEVQMRIPLSLGPPREDLDKSGEVCTVYDVVFHPDAVSGSVKDEEFRSFVMQLTVHQIMQKFKDEVSTDMTFPKIKGNYKGIAPMPQIMRKKGAPPPPMPGSEEANRLAAEKEAAEKAEQQKRESGLGGSSLIAEVEGGGSETQEELLLPAPSYSVEPRRLAKGEGSPDALCVMVALPELDDPSAIELQCSTEQLELLVPSMCRLSLPLPRLVRLPAASAKFEEERRILCVVLKADGSADGGLDGDVHDESGGAAAAGGEDEVQRREREREARMNARRMRKAGNKQLERKKRAEEEAEEEEEEELAEAAAEAKANREEAAAVAAAAAAQEEATATGGEADGGAAAKEAAEAKREKEKKEKEALLEFTNSIMYELEEL